MTRIVFVTPAAERIEIDADDGLSVMECARRANVPGIVAECGGACSCATCHVIVAPEWAERLHAPRADEIDKLDDLPLIEATSRLSCQIIWEDRLDGLALHLPEAV